MVVRNFKGSHDILVPQRQKTSEHQGQQAASGEILRLDVQSVGPPEQLVGSCALLD